MLAICFCGCNKRYHTSEMVSKFVKGEKEFRLFFYGHDGFTKEEFERFCLVGYDGEATQAVTMKNTKNCGNCPSCEWRNRWEGHYRDYLKKHPEAEKFIEGFRKVDQKILVCQRRLGMQIPF